MFESRRFRQSESQTDQTTKAALIALGACALAVVFAIAFWPGAQEPEYQGKKLSEWIDLKPEQPTKVAEAIHAIGTNGVPFLIEWMESDVRAGHLRLWRYASKFPPSVRRSWLVKKFIGSDVDSLKIGRRALVGFQVLGEQGSSAVPRLATVLRRKGSASDFQASMSAQALAVLGKDGLPPLVALASDATQPGTRRHSAFNALRFTAYLGTNAFPAIPTLIACVNDDDKLLAPVAWQTLHNYGREPERRWPGVPPPLLVNGGRATEPRLRLATLRAIGEGLTNFAPVGWSSFLRVVAKTDSDPDVRAEAETALGRINERRDRAREDKNTTSNVHQ